MNNQIRPIVFRKKSDELDMNHIGLFHGFYADSCEMQNGECANYTQALVEDNEGNIFSIIPTWIKFTDKIQLPNEPFRQQKRI
jgi:hypothetical protein